MVISFVFISLSLYGKMKLGNKIYNKYELATHDEVSVIDSSAVIQL